MTISKNGEICLALLVAVLFILPCLMLGLIYEEAPYHTVAGEPVKEAGGCCGDLGRGRERHALEYDRCHGRQDLHAHRP